MSLQTSQAAGHAAIPIEPQANSAGAKIFRAICSSESPSKSWPENTAAELAVAGDVTVRAAEYWMAGKGRPNARAAAVIHGRHLRVTRAPLASKTTVSARARRGGRANAKPLPGVTPDDREAQAPQKPPPRERPRLCAAQGNAPVRRRGLLGSTETLHRR